MTWLIAWLVILVILVIIELVALNFNTVWFACGAGGAAILAVLNAPKWSQLVAFAVASFILFAFVRPSVKRRQRRGRYSERAYKLIGKRGRVVSEIDNWRGIGIVEVQGQEWSAISEEENVIIPPGAIIDVTGYHDGKLVICLDEVMDGNVELQLSEATLDPDYVERGTWYNRDH